MLLFAIAAILVVAMAALRWVLVLLAGCRSKLKNLPGPTDGAFFFGQSLNFMKIPWAPDLFCQWSRRWPDSPLIRYVGFGSTESLLVNDVEAYKDVLTRKSSSFIKPCVARLFTRDFIGDGLPFAEGHLHRVRRASLIRSFSNPQIKADFSMVQAKAAQLASVLSARRNADDEVEVETDIWKIVLDVIGKKIFDIDFNSLGSEECSLFESLSYLMQPSKLNCLVQYVNMIFPIRKLIPWGEIRDFQIHSENARSRIRDLIRQRNFRTMNSLDEKSMDEVNVKQYPDVLHHLLEHNDPLWREDDIVEYLLNTLMLGHDTTACSIIWAVHELSRRPQEQQRLREEIEVSYGLDQPLTYNTIEKLPYLHNFVQEVLRVYSAVAFIPREASEDVEVAGIQISRGTVLQLSPAVINLHPNIWGETSRDFDPSRWERLDGPAGNAYAFQTFHNGPRVCPGKQLALMEIKLVVVELVRRFRIEAVQTEMEIAQPTLTLRPKTKLAVRLVDCHN